MSPFLVSVNIAAAQLRRSNLLQLISAVLTEYDLDPRWLGLEVTESSIMKHAEQTIKTLLDLRELSRLDCDEYQGYLFSKPIPAAEVLPLILGRQLQLARSA